MGFASPLPSQSAFDHYYACLSKYEYSGGASALTRARHRWTAHFLQGRVGLEGRVLDLGCATGWLLEALKEAGFTRVEGLEPAPFAVAEARSKGLDVTEGTLWTLDPGQGPWDLVVLGSVLEHLRDLPEALDRIAGMVRPGGHLHLEVPDGSRYPESTDAPFQEFSVEHINYFGPGTLQRILAMRGFQTVHLESTLDEILPGLRIPEIKALFRKGQATGTGAVRDDSVAAGLAAYVTSCRASEDRLAQMLARLARSQEPILVWGTGTHTQHLLEATPLGRCNIRAFVDRNPRYHGLRMAGRPILPPEAVAGHPEPILIGSFQFQADIERMITGTLALPNPIIFLYPEARAGSGEPIEGRGGPHDELR